MRSSPPAQRALLCFLALAGLAGLAGCDSGMRFELINLERPGSDIGLPPPADFRPCYEGRAQGLDTNGDRRPDVIRVKDDSGRVRCEGYDSNHDGKIDTWDVMDDQGQLRKRAHDSDGDERADETWTFDPARPGCPTIHADRNGDGVPDPTGHVDVCKGLNTDAPPGPLAPPASTTQ